MLKRAYDPVERPAGPLASDLIEAPQAGGLDIMKYAGLVRRRGPLVAAFALIAGLLGTIYALQLIPVYTAAATLLIDPSQGNALAGDPTFAYGGYLDDGKLESELAIIGSTNVARRVVDKLKLANQDGPAVSASSPAASLTDWLVALVSGQPAKSEPPVEITADPREKLAQGLQGGIGVKRSGFSYLINVSYTSDNPSEAAAVANAFAEEYLVDQLESRYEATRRTNDWLNERLGDLRNKVRDSERAVEIYKTQNNIVDTAGTTLGDQQIARFNEQLILARAETAQARASFEQLQAAVKRGGDVSSFADAAQSAAIGLLRSKASEVRRELAELSAKYGSRHPSVVALRAQLADVNGQIGTEASRTVASAQNKYQVAKSREASIEASFNEMKGDATVTNQAEITLRELEREAAANRALYESFLSKFKETSQTETLKSSTARIIERADVPASPSAPNRKRIAMTWLMAGLLLGAALAYLLEQLDSGFRNTEQAEKLLGVPVLASIPKADGGVDQGFIGGLAARFDFVSPLLRLFGARRPGVTSHGKRLRLAMSRLVVDKPLSPFTEAIRSLRMGVRFSGVDQPRKIVMFSSALPGEGKSTIASNFAQHAAAAGERVILVDMDLRHPVLTEIYAKTAKKGLINVALGEAELQDAIIEDAATGMAFLPAPMNEGFTHTAEILGSNRVRDILGQLAKAFDLVVIDTSPLLPVTDGRVLIGSVDAFVLVIKWEATKRDAVEAALHGCYLLDGKFIGTLLNQMIPSRARYYGYYKSGYYMKKYPEYYGGKG